MKKDAENALAEQVGRAIAKRREACGFTQEEVAEKLGIGYEAVSRIERGRGIPTIFRLSEFAEIFNCGIDELILEVSVRSEDRAQYLFELLSKVDDSDKKLIVDIVEQLTERLAKKKSK